MPYRVCKSFEIENGHMLSKHPDKCRFPHGHTRKVECVLVADTLDSREMVCDFKVLKELLGEFLDRYDHAMCMNTEDPEYAHFKAAYGERIIGFTGQDPTTELLAETVYRHLRSRLAEYVENQHTKGPGRYPVRPAVCVERVRVWETSSSWAEYWENT
jgi:6-pyruvoyltetrahydropterin/6-carboxytetrahydropterin synthase